MHTRYQEAHLRNYVGTSPRSDYWPKSWAKMCQDKLRLQCIEFEIILVEIKVETKGTHILNIG